jgi:hypothetical protein
VAIEPRPYLTALRRVVLALPMPREDRDVMLLAIKQRTKRAENIKCYANKPPRTAEQRARKTAADKRYRERQRAKALAAKLACGA